jgi:hypothetical protein
MSGSGSLEDPGCSRPLGRFAMYIPPLLEELGLVELEHNARNNRVLAR